MHKFYYYRDSRNRPMVTVCVMNFEGKITRGIAICSPDDNPCKEFGRMIAFERAANANRLGKPQGIYRGKAHMVLRRCRCSLLTKTNPDPVLTDFERRLLKTETKLELAS